MTLRKSANAKGHFLQVQEDADLDLILVWIFCHVLLWIWSPGVTGVSGMWLGGQQGWGVKGRQDTLKLPAVFKRTSLQGLGSVPTWGLCFVGFHQEVHGDGNGIPWISTCRIWVGCDWRTRWGRVGDSGATEQKPYTAVHRAQQFNPWGMLSGGRGPWLPSAPSSLDINGMELKSDSITPSIWWAF